MGLREGSGRGRTQVALWNALSGLCHCKRMRELSLIQKKFKFKHYLSLKYSLPFLTVHCVLQSIYNLYFSTAGPQELSKCFLSKGPLSYSALPPIPELDKNWVVGRIPKSLMDTYHLLSTLTDRSRSSLPKSNPLIHSAILSGKAYRYATPSSGTSCNHVVCEAVETAPGTKVLDQF